MHWFLISPAECWSLTSWAVVWVLPGRWERTTWLMSPKRTIPRSESFSRVDRPESVTNANLAKVQDLPNIFLKEAQSDHRHQSAGPCITNVFATCRKNFSQWHRSFQRKLRSHWLKFLRHVTITLVIQDPGPGHGRSLLPMCPNWPVSPGTWPA